jgi:hypothetical protein
MFFFKIIEGRVFLLSHQTTKIKGVKIDKKGFRKRGRITLKLRIKLTI